MQLPNFSNGNLKCVAYLPTQLPKQTARDAILLQFLLAALLCRPLWSENSENTQKDKIKKLLRHTSYFV